MQDLQHLSIDAFDYPLPPERIARHPLEQRDKCLLIEAGAPGTAISTHRFDGLPDLLESGSLLVCNDTRVINARLRFRKGQTQDGALIEIFCLEPVAPRDYALNFASTSGAEWLCFVGNSKRWKEGPLRMTLPDGTTLSAERTSLTPTGASTVRFAWDKPSMSFAEVIEAAGEIPIPPYLNRDTEESDSSDYQTVYSRIDGSVAAPTAGLHFTPELMDAVRKKGIGVRNLTLHVGAGTFQPVKADTLGGHTMHSEFIIVPRALIAELAESQGRTVAVGTTSVRTLESLYHIGCLMHQNRFEGELPQWYPYEADHPNLSVKEALNTVLSQTEGDLVATTRLMIGPGYKFRLVDDLITNFHQPHSTLLLLVSAFLGDGGRWREVYDYALADSRVRFLSYGDGCLFHR